MAVVYVCTKGKRVQTVNQKAIARLAGVSQATVSRVLNNSPLLSAATRRNISAKLAKYGYVQNRLAAALRSGQTMTLAFILPRYRYLEGYNTARILSGLGEAANAQGYQLIVTALTEDSIAPEVFRKIIRERNLDGIFTILNAPRLDSGLLAFLKSAPAPLVLVNSNRKENQFVCAGVDNQGGVRQACRYLCEKGLRKIAFLGVKPASLIAQERLAGYRRALREYGINKFREIPVPDAGGDLEFGRRTSLDLLRGPGRPEAIVCYDDHLAMGVLKAAFELGLKAPDDVAVIGFGAIHESAFTIPALTTVQEDGFQVGRTAMDMMADLLKGKRPAKQKIQIPTKLIIRQSA